jgi:hypothetical protein
MWDFLGITRRPRGDHYARVRVNGRREGIAKYLTAAERIYARDARASHSPYVLARLRDRVIRRLGLPCRLSLPHDREDLEAVAEAEKADAEYWARISTLTLIPAHQRWTFVQDARTRIGPVWQHPNPEYRKRYARQNRQRNKRNRGPSKGTQ